MCTLRPLSLAVSGRWLGIWERREMELILDPSLVPLFQPVVESPLPARCVFPDLQRRGLPRGLPVPGLLRDWA